VKCRGLPRVLLWPPDMSPDGKYLIYWQRREASNLMLVEDFH
jgi:hypothetical protein